MRLAVGLDLHSTRRWQGPQPSRGSRSWNGVQALVAAHCAVGEVLQGIWAQ